LKQAFWSAATGITVSAGANDKVILRGLELQGVGGDPVGIKFTVGLAAFCLNELPFAVAWIASTLEMYGSVSRLS
jgi:hypothetical protein